MSEWLGIEELELFADRPPGPMPPVPMRLLDMMRNHGPVEPVVVRKVADRRYEILSNLETWLAAQRLGLREVPVEVRLSVSDSEAADIVEASYRRHNPDPIREAQQLAERLEELGGGAKWGATRRLASITGLSRSYISHALRLLSLPLTIQDLVRSGELPVGHAKLLVTIKDRQRQLALARKITTERLSVRTTEELARAARAGQAPMTSAQRPKPDPDPDVQRLEQSLTELLGCRTHIDNGAGTLVIDYGHDLDILDGVLGRLGYQEY